MFRSKNPLFLALSAAVISLALPATAFSQSTWIGVGTSGTPAVWSDGANWSASAPSSNSTISLLFNNTSANSWSNNDLVGLVVTDISIPASFNSINVKDNTITGNAITLTGNITVATGNFQTIGLNMDLSTGTRTFNQTTGQTTLSGNLSGSANITKIGGGTVVLSGTNNFSGNVTVSGGALSITSSSALGTTAGRTTANGGRLDISNNVVITGETLEIAGNAGSNEAGVFRNVSGSNTWAGNVTTVGNGSRITAAAGTLTISGVISSTNANNDQVIFRGQGGTIELTNANTYNGTTRIFGTPSDASIPMLRLSGGNNRLLTTTTIDIGGGGVSGHLQISGISQEVAGLVSNSGATTSRISGVGAATLVVNNSTDGTFTGVLTDSLAFTKSGAARYTLSGNNTYTGNTTINAGTLAVSSKTGLGATNSTVTINAGSGAALELATSDGALTNAYNLNMGSNRFNTIVLNRATLGEAAYVLGNLALGASTMTFNRGANISGNASVAIGTLDLSAGNNDRPVILNGNATINVGNAGIFSNNTVNKRLQLDGTATNNTIGTISNGSGSGVLSLIKDGSGTWTLNGNNTYTGGTTINAGTLSANRSESLGASSGSLTFAGNSTLATTANITSTRNYGINSSVNATIDTAASTTLTNNGVVSGAGNLLKAGLGTLALGGNNSLSGAAVVNSGKLQTLAADALRSVSAVSVASTATLEVAASNSVHDAAAVNLAGGTILRGAAVSETFGALTLTANSFIDYGATGTGTLNFNTYSGGSNKLAVTNFREGSILTFKTDLSASITNTSLFTFDSGFTSSWNNTSNTFTITAIPEPSTIIAGILFLGLCCYRERRRIRLLSVKSKALC